jgi:hypothetical protein
MGGAFSIRLKHLALKDINVLDNLVVIYHFGNPSGFRRASFMLRKPNNWGSLSGEDIAHRAASEMRPAAGAGKCG